MGKEAFVEQHPNLERILFSEDEIRTRVKEMGAQITEDYAGKSIVVISVLRGAAIFMADLVREIPPAGSKWTTWPFLPTATA